MAPIKKNFKAFQGSTFSEVLRWESPNIIYKNITGITKAAPMVVTAVAHGLVIGWRAKISNVNGMKEANSDDYAIISNITTDTITFNSINAAGYTAYTNGGILYYNQPVSLTSYTARMQIRPTITSDIILVDLTTANGGIILDDTTKTITINITAIATAALTFKSAIYSLEMVNGTIVTPLITGNITLEPEITR